MKNARITINHEVTHVVVNKNEHVTVYLRPAGVGENTDVPQVQVELRVTPRGYMEIFLDKNSATIKSFSEWYEITEAPDD